MNRCRPLAAVLLIGGVCLAVAGEDNPLTPVEARKKVGKKITVEMTVKASKDRLEKRGEIYLDSETDFRDEKNFAVVLTRAGAASLKKAGIDNPAEHYKDRKIRASGTVKEVDKVPRIEIDDAKQIRLVKARSDDAGWRCARRSYSTWVKWHGHTIWSAARCSDRGPAVRN
jgi:hypothetical protein